jgi:hypothetical protein
MNDITGPESVGPRELVAPATELSGGAFETPRD